MVSTSKPLLEAQGISKRKFGGGYLFHQFSFALACGEIIALMGKSGEGKTLLLKSLALLCPIEQGKIFYQGRLLGDLSAGQISRYRAEVLYIDQFSQLPSGDVEGYLRRILSFAIYQHHRVCLPDDLGAVLELLGLSSSFLARKTKDLSGGEQQLVNMLKIALLRPKLLLLDEPTAAMDIQTKRRAEGFLQEYIHQGSGEGRGCLWVTHEERQAREVATAERVLSFRGYY